MQVLIPMLCNCSSRSTEPLSYKLVNPYCLTDAVAPHLAAAKAGACD